MVYGLVNQTIASLRNEAKSESELVDEELYGMKVQILAGLESELDPKLELAPNSGLELKPWLEPKVGLEPKSGIVSEWYQIKTSYQYIGYVHKSEILIDSDMVETWEMRDKKVVVHSYADVLSIPKVQGYCMISLTRGAVVTILCEADKNGWIKVGLCDGREGYIKEKFLGEYVTTWYPKDEVKLRNNIINTALLYMGTQYRWGGKTPLGVDCSGLCFTAYRLNGITIYRDAKIVEGFPIHEIAYEDLKPCDLLYFPGHVAMYMEKDKFIHATGKNGSDGVVINSFNPRDFNYRGDLREKLIAIGSIF